ncbi:MAG: ABA4-like family protein [Aureispira sp.]
MNIDQAFTILNSSVLLPWLLMVIAPKWKFTQQMIQLKWPVLLYAIVYVVLLVMIVMTTNNSSMDFMSLQAIKAAFGQDQVMLLGWVHYLAFDLFVGMWALKDGQTRGVPHYLMVPCLIFTLMYGPVGLLLYSILRYFYAPKETSTII